jgi:hypothetical protein
MPVSALCMYREGTKRCRRIATINGELCRHHAIRLELEIDRDHPLDEVIEAVDRHIARHPDPFVTVLTGVFGRLFGRGQPQPPPASPDPRRAPPHHSPPRAPPRQPPPRPAPVPNPVLVARELLGFEPTEPLTVERVQKRKQALARVFHPDLPGGSENQMKRINQAADLLLSKL